MSGPTRLIAGGYDRLLRPAMFKAFGGDPETIHERMIATLAQVGDMRIAHALLRVLVGRPHQPTTVAGITFPGRVGLAAGLDKNGEAARAWAGFGFAFAELGTVTGRPQPGNDKPRIFRLPTSHAIINRMGFNNAGADALAHRLEVAGIRRGNNKAGIPLGISIGKTKVVPVQDALEDYLHSFGALAPYADYVAVNVSSPNTPGLRSLQDGGALAELVSALTTAAREQSASPVPAFVKIAPDLTDAQLDGGGEVCEHQGAAGLIATNTTLARSGLELVDLPTAEQTGGLSGAPLTRRALQVVRRLCAATELPVMGVGGIMTAGDAQAMFDAGAALVQVYTGFIYHGPALIRAINELPEATRD